MKKIYFLSFFIFLLFSCPGPRCEVRGTGSIELKVLDEDGLPLKYEDAKYFEVINGGRELISGVRALINEDNVLIYEMAIVEVKYYDCKRLKKGDDFTDAEIVGALADSGVFSIKDIRIGPDGKHAPLYKTIVDMPYKNCYKTFERTSRKPTTYHSEPNHIYYCEVRLTKR